MNTVPSARRIATPTELGFSVMFGLQPMLASLLAQMFAGAAVKALRTHIHKLRSALTDEAIDTTQTGYRLTDIGMVECREALADFRAWVSEERAA
jgi:hypothetical protein